MNLDNLKRALRRTDRNLGLRPEVDTRRERVRRVVATRPGVAIVLALLVVGVIAGFVASNAGDSDQLATGGRPNPMIDAQARSGAELADPADPAAPGPGAAPPPEDAPSSPTTAAPPSTTSPSSRTPTPSSVPADQPSAPPTSVPGSPPTTTTTTSAVPPPEPYRIVVDLPFHTDDGDDAPTGTIEAVLAGDVDMGGGCLWIEVAGRGRESVRFTEGYQARFFRTESGFESFALLDETGRRVASEGDEIVVTGELPGSGLPIARCQVSDRDPVHAGPIERAPFEPPAPPFPGPIAAP